jgi:hypothetical protein
MDDNECSICINDINNTHITSLFKNRSTDIYNILKNSYYVLYTLYICVRLLLL